MRQSSNTSTVIIGEHTLLREGLAALLQHSPYKVVASAGTASDLGDIRVGSNRRPLAILAVDDTEGGPAKAADNIHALRTRFNSPTIVVVSETRNPVDINEIISLAPNGYIANLTSRELLLKVLDLSTSAQLVLVLSSVTTTASSSERLARRESSEGSNGNGHSPTNGIGRNGQCPLFSQREQQILHQLAQGSSNKEIARLFTITESTVKVHLKALLRKIGARNRTQAAIWAVARESDPRTRQGVCGPSPSIQPAAHSLGPITSEPLVLTSVQNEVPAPRALRLPNR